MDSFVYDCIKEAEETDWWYRGLHNIALHLIQRYHPKGGSRLLDAGCGTGYFLKKLEKEWDVYGIDISQKVVDLALSRKLRNIHLADIEKMPFKDNYFDVVLVLDVIEHVKNDLSALSEIYRVLKPGGVVIFNTPAFQFLWSFHDVTAKHFRRYTVPEFAQKLTQQKFRILKISYINFLLFPIALLHRTLAKLSNKRGKTDIGSVPNILNELFYKIFSWEAFLLEKFNLPWGLSVSAVATK